MSKNQELEPTDDGHPIVPWPEPGPWRKENAELHAKIAELTQTIGEKQQRIEQAEQLRASMQKRISQLEAKNEQLKEQIEELDVDWDMQIEPPPRPTEQAVMSVELEKGD